VIKHTDCLEVMLKEADAAELRYGPFTSSHEALGVVTEEYHELVGAVMSNDLDRVRAEALQVAACALRFAEACGLKAFIERSHK
jgi:hypothetical protein